MQTKAPAVANDHADPAATRADSVHADGNIASFADHRPGATAQRMLHASIGASARMQGQRTQMAAIDASPRMALQRRAAAAFGDADAAAVNKTGLPDHLKSGVESLSGMRMDHVKVHYNSSQPAQLGAFAYARGSDIHVAPGQERHLPHEAWHVVQQARGRVPPTGQVNGAPINDNGSLEREADSMGAQAMRHSSGIVAPLQRVARKTMSLAGGVHQRKGDIGGDTRATARRLAIVGGNLQNALYAVVLPLLGMQPAQDIENALGAAGGVADTRALFTSVARGNGVVRNHAGGLLPATILADGAACQDDALGGLLDLSLAIQLGAGNPLAVPTPVRLGLLGSGRTVPAICAAALAIPALLVDVAGAQALVDHLAAGGSAADATRAAAFAPANAGVLVEALTALRALVGIDGMAGMAQDKVDALLGERAQLTTPTLRGNAVAMTVGAADAGTAVNLLQTHRAFGYVPEFTNYANARGAEAANALVPLRLHAVGANANLARQQANLDQNEEAFNTLSRRERERLGDSAENALVKPRPQVVGIQDFDAAKLKLENKRRDLAQPAVTLIDQQEVLDRANVVNVEGPAEEARVRELHRAYFAGVNFHPDALAALNAAEQDRPLATALVQALVATPAVRPVFLGGGIAVGRIRRLVPQAATLDALIALGVTAPAIRDYGANDNYLALLVVLHGANVPFARINSLAPLLAGFAAYFNDGISRGHLAALLMLDIPTDIAPMLAAAPGPQLTRAALIAGVRARAASAADLTVILTLCDTFGWSQADVTLCLTGQAPGSALAVLRGAVHAAHLVRFNKFAAFGQWLDAIGQLVVEGYVAIAANGGWGRLNGLPLTDERNYNVTLVVGGALVGSFCVHYHPGAHNAGVGNPNASVSHFKPERGGDIRRGYEIAPQSVRNHTQRRP